MWVIKNVSFPNETKSLSGLLPSMPIPNLIYGIYKNEDTELFYKNTWVIIILHKNMPIPSFLKLELHFSPVNLQLHDLFKNIDVTKSKLEPPVIVLLCIIMNIDNVWKI